MKEAWEQECVSVSRGLSNGCWPLSGRLALLAHNRRNGPHYLNLEEAASVGPRDGMKPTDEA
jgi:hypothetical protein